jgi:hypothetical protein
LMTQVYKRDHFCYMALTEQSYSPYLRLQNPCSPPASAGNIQIIFLFTIKSFARAL